MALVVDGNSEIGAHIRCTLFYLISFMHLVGSKAVTFMAVTDRFYSPNRPSFLHACATCSELPSNTMCMNRIEHLQYVHLIQELLYKNGQSSHKMVHT